MELAIDRCAILQPTGCVVRPQQEGYLFYNARTDELHLVPEAGFLIYQLCDGLRTVDEIEQWLAQASSEPRPATSEALGRFLDALVARGIVEALDEPH
ncbi:MAG: PqqD family peptide modification chaperone [Proteobacteria bacterium]|nr:PqqD family peptide modification chaperone [Pseudomonadota bacterium]